MSEKLESLEQHIDSLLLTLRWAMLGYLTPCLPAKLVTRSEQRRAIRAAAEHLTLCFAITNADASIEELYACRRSLYAYLTYLYFECRVSDQTYASLLKLAALDEDVLSIMLAHAHHTPHSFSTRYSRATQLDGNLESAVLLILQQCGGLPEPWVCTAATDRALQTLQAAS